MELNSKKLGRISRIIYYSISIILCLFLILLSNEIIDDLDSAIKMPYSSNFENKAALALLKESLETQNVELRNLNSRKNTIELTRATAESNYNNEKKSFDNWLEARRTLGSPDQDREVLNRARRLDGFYKIEQEWSVQLNALQSQIDELMGKREEIQKSIREEDAEANRKYEKALRWYHLKVFLIRLLFVLPVLALGVFFFIRCRRHKFYPLYFGFTLFSLYAFFFGLLPYLPSYGGYVHYSVGIILSVGLGYYLIKHIKQFIEKKQAELEVSTQESMQERAKKIQTEAAEKAWDGHFCPSCGKDFFLCEWELPTTKAIETDIYKSITTFCRYCGLELFKNCSNCETKNFAHFPFCLSCGTKIAKNE